MRSRAGSGLGHRATIALWCLMLGDPALAQDPHAGMAHDMASPGWTFMQDAVVFLMLNDQGSPRGEREVKAPNWWMGMAQKPIGRGRLTLTLMLSLDPATVGNQGYGHIFQIGEAFDGN